MVKCDNIQGIDLVKMIDMTVQTYTITQFVRRIIKSVTLNKVNGPIATQFRNYSLFIIHYSLKHPYKLPIYIIKKDRAELTTRS